MTDLRTRARHLTPVPDSRLEYDAMQWKIFQAYMAMGVNFDITLNTVSISFDRRVEAEEFRKFAMQSRRPSSSPLPQFAHEKDRSQQGGSSQ